MSLDALVWGHDPDEDPPTPKCDRAIWAVAWIIFLIGLLEILG